MIRVVHVSETIAASAGGTSTAFVELVEALLTQKEAVRVTAVSQPLAAGDGAEAWIKHHQPGLWLWPAGTGKVRPGAMGAAVIGMIERGEVDVVHLHGLWLIDLVAIAKAARRRGVSVVWQPHGMMVQAAMRHKALKKSVFLMLGLAGELKQCSAAIFTSEVERDTSRLEMLGSQARREIVPLPVPIVLPEAELPRLSEAGRARWLKASEDPERTLMAGKPLPDVNTPLLVFMGRLHPVKRVELTLRAFARVRAEMEGGSGAKLLLIGSGEAGYVQTLRDLAGELGVQDAVLWAGWLNGMDKWKALAAADALIINSEFENFGYAIVEALAAGTPTVMTENLSLAAAVAEVGAGSVGKEEPESLAKAAIEVLSRGDKADMGHRGRRWVEENFSREAVGRRLVGVYEGLRRGKV